MNHQATIDALSEAIDSFEENWSPSSGGQLRQLLRTYGINQEIPALTELIRIDVELRHKRGIEFSLDGYFEEFSDLLSDRESVEQIAFEDYRCHLICGLPISLSRWQHLPGVTDQHWFRSLADGKQGLVEASLDVPRGAIETASLLPHAIFRELGFRLIKEIGHGAFSRVYLATQDELANRYVVLKLVEHEVAESHCMAMLQHTNIVPIYSFHSIGVRSVICMPYAGCVTLASFLKIVGAGHERCGEALATTVRSRVNETIHEVDGPKQGYAESWHPAADDPAVLKPLERLKAFDCELLATWLVGRLASALAHSHARGILHGDIKPGNVLIRNDGEPALLDFNLSQSIGFPKTKIAGGTLPYMSPESYRSLMGQAIVPGAASDIYGLGVILFEFLTGRLPYKTPVSMAPIDLELAIIARKSVPEWLPGDAVSPGLRSIINRALAFEPEARYAAAEKLYEDLECERNHFSLLHAPEPQTNQIAKWFRRHPRTLSGGSVGLALLMLLVPLSWTVYTLRLNAKNAAATERFRDFEGASADAIASWLVDPKRNDGNGVADLLAPLQRFKILSDEGLEQLGWERLSTDVLDLRRPVLMRHLVQLGIAESRQLRVASRQNVGTGKSFANLDAVIATTEKLLGDEPSRACQFLKAQRARFSKDSSAFESLRTEALRLPLSNDTEIYLEAVRLMSNQRWFEASPLLTSLADRNSIPPSWRWTMLGMCQYAAGDYQNAQVSYTQSIERSPVSAALYLMRGHCYRQLLNPSKAEDDFTEAIRLDRKLLSAWSGRALVRLNLDRIDDGLSDLNRGLELQPGNIQLLLMRSRALKRTGDTEGAERDFATAKTSETYTSDELISRAIARATEEPEAALADLQLADSLDPENTVTMINIANVLASYLNRRDEAIEVLDEVLRLEPNHERAAIDRAILFAYAGKHEQAKKHLLEALTPPNSARTLYQAACISALANVSAKKIDALSYLSQAIQAGYVADRLSVDPDLASIRDMPGFMAIQRAYQISLLHKPTINRPSDNLIVE